jgi:ribosomal RNA small subunit methyltransferase I
LQKIKYSIIFYESVHHIQETLNLIYSVFGNRRVAICRELTKMYEECVRDELENIINNFNVITLKGEFVIVVEGNNNDVDYSDLNLIDHVNLYISDGFEKMEAIKKTSKDLNLSKSEVYKKYHEGN